MGTFFTRGASQADVVAEGHTWADKLAWVGLEWETIRPDDDRESFGACDTLSLSSRRIAVRIDAGGRVSFGVGDTLELALEDGARGHDIDWSSVERKMTEAAWTAISHC